MFCKKNIWGHAVAAKILSIEIKLHSNSDLCHRGNLWSKPDSQTCPILSDNFPKRNIEKMKTNIGKIVSKQSQITFAKFVSTEKRQNCAVVGVLFLFGEDRSTIIGSLTTKSWARHLDNSTWNIAQQFLTWNWWFCLMYRLEWRGFTAPRRLDWMIGQNNSKLLSWLLAGRPWMFPAFNLKHFAQPGEPKCKRIEKQRDNVETCF